MLSLLQALVDDPVGVQIGNETAVDLFKAYTMVWKSADLGDGSEGPASGAQKNLAKLTPISRQAFLLTAVEGFSPGETARILDVFEDQIGDLIDQAGREIGEQVATSILIIEDEPLIAMDIEQLVMGLGHEVTAIARTQSEAVAFIEDRKPGMVLADIQLADGSSGIDAVNEILTKINVPVIFITAYPERLLTGERPEPAFLITKPFMPDMVTALISQALFFERNAGQTS